MANKYFWTTDETEKIKASKVQSLKICKQIFLEELSYIVVPVIGNKEHDKSVARDFGTKEEAVAWINKNFK